VADLKSRLETTSLKISEVRQLIWTRLLHRRRSQQAEMLIIGPARHVIAEVTNWRCDSGG